MATDLITKLEEAGEGSRELDALVWLHFNRPEYQGGVKALEMRTWYDGRGHLILETDAGEEVADDLSITGVTTSLDAALALAERVLPWACVGLAQLSPGNWQAWIGGRPAFATAYSTAPLALCIAILRASEQERGG